LKKKLKIAFLGSRGIPARYSGFETFYENLSCRLVKRGHDVTVYNRSLFIKDVKEKYKGVNILSLPSIPTKHLDTISHTLISTIHSLFRGYDVIYYCIVGNSPLVWVPRILGIHTLLNVDGEDWSREKWGLFARWYQKMCELIATKTPRVIIADSKVIQERYKKIYNTESIYVPYGANIKYTSNYSSLSKWNLIPRNYILFVGRLVPENEAHLLIKAYRQIQSDIKLVIIGDCPYMNKYKKMLRDLADDRVVFTGYVFGQDYIQLSSHAYLFVLPSAIEGTRPALLDQIGFGNCVVVRGNRANREVVSDYGIVFENKIPLKSLIDTIDELIKNPNIVERYRKRARKRIETFYNWEWITSFYEDLFIRLLNKKSLISYDAFLRKNEII